MPPKPVSLQTSDGICLLTGKNVTPDCKADCKDCKIYKDYEEDMRWSFPKLFKKIFNKCTKFGLALFTLGFVLFVFETLYPHNYFNTCAVELALMGLIFMAWGVIRSE